MTEGHIQGQGHGSRSISLKNSFLANQPSMTRDTSTTYDFDAMNQLLASDMQLKITFRVMGNGQGQFRSTLMS